MGSGHRLCDRVGHYELDSLTRIHQAMGPRSGRPALRWPEEGYSVGAMMLAAPLSTGAQRKHMEMLSSILAAGGIDQRYGDVNMRQGGARKARRRGVGLDKGAVLRVRAGGTGVIRGAGVRSCLNRSPATGWPDEQVRTQRLRTGAPWIILGV